MQRPFTLLISTVYLVAAGVTQAAQSRITTTKTFKNLNFRCRVRNNFSSLFTPKSHILYIPALYLQRKAGPKHLDNIARHYQIASSYNPFKAATRLQALLTQGFTFLENPEVETVELVRNSLN